MRYKGAEIPDEHVVVRPKAVVEDAGVEKETPKKSTPKPKKAKASRDDLEALVKDDLIAMARRQGIETKGLTKVELIDAILG